VIDRGDWKPIKYSLHGPVLPNLFLADDIVLFTEASVQQARVIKKCLDIFYHASGQKVSYLKSRIQFFSNISEDNMNLISQELHI